MTEPALHIERLSVHRGSRQVLSDVTFNANHGDIVAIVGPNGAGKSTLLKAAAGLLPATGTVRIDGHDLTELPIAERVQRMAYLPQVTRLQSALIVQDVVAQARYRIGASQKAVDHAMALVDVAGLAMRPFTKLSGGEQRRVLLARALATDAKLILLDEPTAGLDMAHALRLHALLRDLANDGYCIAVVLHSLQDVLRATDRAYLLDKGCVVAHGPSSEVINPDVIGSVYGVVMSDKKDPVWKLDSANR